MQRACEPETTLVIIIGASEFPDFPILSANAAFLHSRNRIRDYFLSQERFNLSESNLLDLFDDESSMEGLDFKISSFIAKRRKELSNIGGSLTDIIIYYVGHGSFNSEGSEYFLVLRKTREDFDYFSGYPIKALAQTLRSTAAGIRKYLILDSCFSAAAYASFQAPPLTIAKMQVSSLLPPTEGIHKGTALLCASGPKEPAKSPVGAKLTMFTEALVEVLENGKEANAPFLSLQDVGVLTQTLIGNRHHGDGVRPQVLCPDQAKGDVSLIPIFPNPGFRGNTAPIPPTLPKPGEPRANYAPTRPIPPKSNRKTFRLLISAVLICFVAVCVWVLRPKPQPLPPITGRAWTEPLLDLPMVWIPPGNFTMGSPEEWENPRTVVIFNEGFWLGACEVTQKQWLVLMDSNPSKEPGSQLPVTNITYDAAKKFCRELNKRSKHVPAGYEFALPTEPQWEYACRASEPSDSELLKIAWYGDNSGLNVHPAHSVSESNAWGLRDMLGNVWEWCDSEFTRYPGGTLPDPPATFSDKGMVFRGGSFANPSSDCRPAKRNWDPPDRKQGGTVGFRLALRKTSLVGTGARPSLAPTPIPAPSWAPFQIEALSAWNTVPALRKTFRISPGFHVNPKYGPVLMSNEGNNAAWAEYRIVSPEPCYYSMQISYASGDSRPVDLYVKDVKVATICATPTGGFEMPNQHTEVVSSHILLEKGDNTLRLTRDSGPFPHILRFTLTPISIKP